MQITIKCPLSLLQSEVLNPAPNTTIPSYQSPLNGYCCTKCRISQLPATLRSNSCISYNNFSKHPGFFISKLHSVQHLMSAQRRTGIACLSSLNPIAAYRAEDRVDLRIQLTAWRNPYPAGESFIGRRLSFLSFANLI